MERIAQAPRSDDPADASGGARPIAARRHPLVARVERNLREKCAVDPGRSARIVLGVSGGADSVALLLALVVLRERGEAVQPHVVHVNHHLREAAAEDAAFVRSLAARLEAPYREFDVHPGEAARNVYAAARSMRYEALLAAAEEVGAGFVAVAHHADDQFETVLMNLSRGSGLDGLSGMRWRRAWSAERASPAVIRPLLDVPKDECESLCRSAGIEWRIDPSNEQVEKVRARLRRDVTPVLEELWPGAAGRVSATAESLGEVAELLESLVDSQFGPPERREWPRSLVAEAPRPVAAAALRRAAGALLGEEGGGDALTRDHVEQLVNAARHRDSRPRSFDWPCNLRGEVTSKAVRIEPARE